jgi:hypothetical protein
MVQRKRLLESLGGRLARGEQRPGIVGEDVNLRLAPAHLLGQRPHLGHQHQVGDVLMDRRTAAGRPGFQGDSLDALGVATGERNLGALPGKLDRGGASDAASGTSQQHERHVADSTCTRAHRSRSDLV